METRQGEAATPANGLGNPVDEWCGVVLNRRDGRAFMGESSNGRTPKYTECGFESRLAH